MTALTSEDPLVIVTEPGETPAVTLRLSEVARRLGGEIIGPGRILCPAPDCPPDDRSMMVTFRGVAGVEPQ
jgi:hypothetical protein